MVSVWCRCTDGGPSRLELLLNDIHRRRLLFRLTFPPLAYCIFRLCLCVCVWREEMSEHICKCTISLKTSHPCLLTHTHTHAVGTGRHHELWHVKELPIMDQNGTYKNSVLCYIVEMFQRLEMRPLDIDTNIYSTFTSYCMQ